MASPPSFLALYDIAFLSYFSGFWYAFCIPRMLPFIGHYICIINIVHNNFHNNNCNDNDDKNNYVDGNVKIEIGWLMAKSGNTPAA